MADRRARLSVVVLNTAQFRLLLAGPRVSRLLPFLAARGYVADAATDGQEALAHMRAAPRHLLLLELELGDMLLADLLDVVRAENLAGAIILLEDPARSGLIVSNLVRGLDGYVATPPDEGHLFRLVERQLLAQWALAQMASAEASAAEISRLDAELGLERKKVTDLEKEIESLRDEAAALRAKAAARGGTAPAPIAERSHAVPLDEDLARGTAKLVVGPGAPGKLTLGPAALAELELDDDDDDDLFGEPTSQGPLVDGRMHHDFDSDSDEAFAGRGEDDFDDIEDVKTETSLIVPRPQPDAPPAEDRTSRYQWQAPTSLRGPAQSAGFDDIASTRAEAQASAAPATASRRDDDDVFDEDSDPDLFLDPEDQPPARAKDG